MFLFMCVHLSHTLSTYERKRYIFSGHERYSFKINKLHDLTVIFPTRISPSFSCCCLHRGISSISLVDSSFWAPRQPSEACLSSAFQQHLLFIGAPGCSKVSSCSGISPWPHVAKEVVCLIISQSGLVPP